MRTRKAGESALLLLDAVAVLLAASVDYAVIGAMAAAVHGVVRASMDADAVLSIGVREAQRLQVLFATAGFAVELRKGDFGDPIAAVLEARDSFDNRVDLLIGLKGMDAAVFNRAVEVAFGGEVIKVVGREDFIAMKLFAGGTQSLSDAKLAAASAEHLDIELIGRLVQAYGPDAVRNYKALFPSV